MPPSYYDPTKNTAGVCLQGTVSLVINLTLFLSYGLLYLRRIAIAHSSHMHVLVKYCWPLPAPSILRPTNSIHVSGLHVGKAGIESSSDVRRLLQPWVFALAGKVVVLS